jgi:hypothetical protein
VADPTAPDGLNGIRFAALLQILQHKHDEFTSVAYMTPEGVFTSVVKKPCDALAFVMTLRETCTWFGVNPVRGPAREHAGRGKPRMLPDWPHWWPTSTSRKTACKSPHTAWAIIEDFSEILDNTPPSAITHTGHGLQPFWRVNAWKNSQQDNEALLSRWKRLVKAVAAKHDAKVDTFLTYLVYCVSLRHPTANSPTKKCR